MFSSRFSTTFMTIMMMTIIIMTMAPAHGEEPAPTELTQAEQAAIEDAVREAEAEVAGFAAEVAARAESYSEEAHALVDSVNRRIKNIEATPDGGGVDFGAMLQGAASIADAKDAPSPVAGVMVFVSFGMPEEALKALVLDAREANVPVLLQGFVDGSLAETAKRMRDLLGDSGGPELEADAIGGVLIDPRAFRIFAVTEAPLFVATASPLPDCDGLDCSAPPPAHDRIAGNMSLNAALSILSQEGVEARAQSTAALARLERAQ